MPNKSNAGRAKCVMEKHLLGFLDGETLKGARSRRSPRVFTARSFACLRNKIFRHTSCPHLVINQQAENNFLFPFVVIRCKNL